MLVLIYLYETVFLLNFTSQIWDDILMDGLFSYDLFIQNLKVYYGDFSVLTDFQKMYIQLRNISLCFGKTGNIYNQESGAMTNCRNSFYQKYENNKMHAINHGLIMM